MYLFVIAVGVGDDVREFTVGLGEKKLVVGDVGLVHVFGGGFFVQVGNERTWS